MTGQWKLFLGYGPWVGPIAFAKFAGSFLSLDEAKAWGENVLKQEQVWPVTTRALWGIRYVFVQRGWNGDREAWGLHLDEHNEIQPGSGRLQARVRQAG